jgi:hypothetical protein
MTTSDQDDGKWLKLKEYDLYQLASPVPSAEPSARACTELPYVALPPGATPPPEWDVVTVRSRYRGDRVRMLLGLDWLISHHVDLINLSLGFHGKADPDDPLHVATRTATERGIGVVVAAGNDGPYTDSMQELARDPWVIAVGATDQDGHLLPSSSRGSATAAGPAVVADGTPDRLRQEVLVDFTKPQPDGEPTVRSFPSLHPGTSFAAPRVANAVIFIRKMVEVTWSLYRASVRGGDKIVVKLPVLGVADTGLDPDFLPDDMGPYRRQLRADGIEELELPARDAARDWFGKMTERLAAAGISLDDADLGAASEGPPWLEGSRRILRSAAVPVASAEPWETGSGLVTREAVHRFFFADFTPSVFLDTFFPLARPKASAEDLAAIDRELDTPWSGRDIDYLADVFSTGILLAVAKVV